MLKQKTTTKTAETKPKEDWMNRKWRPAMAWLYLVVCVTDFILFPIFWTIIQVRYTGHVTESWEPLTLKGAGLFHLALGAVLGISAWSRGQEKMRGSHYDYDYDRYDSEGYNSSRRRSSRYNRIPKAYDDEL